MFIRNHIQQLSLCFVLLTVLGITVHDTKLDAMTTMAIALPLAIATYEGAHAALLFGDSHTHVEASSIRKVADKNTSLNPCLKTRDNEDKKYRLPKQVTRGRHPFDNYSLPAIA